MKYLNLIGIKKFAMQPQGGSVSRISAVNRMVDKMFQESSTLSKRDGYKTMNDKFFNEPANASIRESSSRRKNFEELRAEAKANDAAVLRTNVRIGSYTGWKPPSKLKHNLPKAKTSSKMNLNGDQSDLTPSTMMDSLAPHSALARDAPPNLIWNESDMFKTTK